jgi:hypothetical protein
MEKTGEGAGGFAEDVVLREFLVAVLVALLVVYPHAPLLILCDVV